MKHMILIALCILSISTVAETPTASVINAYILKHYPTISTQNAQDIANQIVKESEADGSYIAFTEHIAKAGTIDSPDHGINQINNANRENPAVRETEQITTHQVTDEDVQKVRQQKEVLLFTANS